MFHKKNLWKSQPLIFFVVTMSFLLFLINLVWLSNMGKLKFSIFLGYIKSLTSPLDLSTLGGSILYPKDTWCYLVFIFDKKLTFWQHINFYTNKALSIVRCIKILGNLLQDLIPNQKCMLYITCVLSIALYNLPLWYYNKAPLTYLLKELRKMQ